MYYVTPSLLTNTTHAFSLPSYLQFQLVPLTTSSAVEIKHGPAMNYFLFKLLLFSILLSLLLLLLFLVVRYNTFVIYLS